MSHDSELIDGCVRQLREMYPSRITEYRRHAFEIERRLVHPGARVTLMPDVAIYANSVGTRGQITKEHLEVVCVVEIGLTRPEKLLEYTRLGIPDIRWYPKHLEWFWAIPEWIIARGW